MPRAVKRRRHARLLDAIADLVAKHEAWDRLESIDPDDVSPRITREQNEAARAREAASLRVLSEVVGERGRTFDRTLFRPPQGVVVGRYLFLGSPGECVSCWHRVGETMCYGATIHLLIVPLRHAPVAMLPRPLPPSMCEMGVLAPWQMRGGAYEQ